MLSTMPARSRQAKKSSRAAQHLVREDRVGAMKAPSAEGGGGGREVLDEEEEKGQTMVMVVGGRGRAEKDGDVARVVG